MATSNHVVYVRYEKDKCNLFKLHGDLERRAHCHVQKRERHRSEPNTEVFFLRSADEVDEVMRRKEKFETKFNVTLHGEDPKTAGKSADVRPNVADKSDTDSNATNESNVSFRANATKQESPELRTSHHRGSALDVPSKEVVPLQPWELKLLRLGILEKLRQSMPGVEFTGDGKTREMYLLGPQEAVEAFKSDIHNFLKGLQSQEWKCSDDLANWLSAENGPAYVEKEFERKKICAALSIQEVQSSKTSSYQVLVWGRCQDDVNAAILELEAMLTSVTLTLTPELEARLRDHEDEDSPYNMMERAQGLLQITVEPRNGLVHLTGLASEVEWIKGKVGGLQSTPEEPASLYDHLTFADREGGEEEESICPDLPLCLRRLLHRHQQWLRDELQDPDVEEVFELVSGSPCLRLYGCKEHCDLAQEKLKDMKAKVKEDEFEVPDLAIILFLDTPEGSQVLAMLEDELRIIFEVNMNRTLPDSNVTSGRKERKVERVIYDDGSYAFKLKNERSERAPDIYEDVEDFYQLRKDGIYEDSVEILDDDEWTEQKKGMELPERKEGLCETTTSRQQLPDQRHNWKGKVDNDNYVMSSSLGRAKAGMFEVTATSGDDRAQLVDAKHKLLHLLVEHGDLVALTSGADAVINFVVDSTATSGSISSLVPENHRTAIQEELKVKGETLKSQGLAEGEAVGELGCGDILHVEVRAGSNKVKDAVTRALSYAFECGQRVLVIPVQGLVDSGDADQVAQLCAALQDFPSDVPEAIKEVKLVCPDACTVSRIRDYLAAKASEEGREEGTYGDVTFPDSVEDKSRDLTDLTWDNSELTGVCNKEMRSVFLRVTYMDPLTLWEVVQRLKGKLYTRILTLTIKHSFIKQIYAYQCQELFSKAGDNVLVVVEKKDGLIHVLGTPDEATKASEACKSVLEQAKDDYKRALSVEWCFLDGRDLICSPGMEESCRWERSWQRDCQDKRPHFKIKLESGKHMVHLDALRIFPFQEPTSWMPLLRVDKNMELPNEWDGSENVSELLSVGNQEFDYASVVDLLKNRVVSGHKFSLIKVERVKNAQLWRQFRTMRHQLAPPCKRRRRFSLVHRRGPDFLLWCDVSSAQAKDILILGLRPLLRWYEHVEGQTQQQHGGLTLYSTPRRAVQAAWQKEQLGKERVLVQVEAVAPSLQKDVAGVSAPSLQALGTCFVDSPRKPFRFLLASHVLTYPRLFATYRLVKS